MSSTVPPSSSSPSTVSAFVNSSGRNEKLRRAVLQDPYLRGLAVRERTLAALLLEEMAAEEFSALNLEFEEARVEAEGDNRSSEIRDPIQRKQEQLRRVLESGWSAWTLHRRSAATSDDDVAVIIRADASDLHLHGPEEDLLPLLVILFWPCMNRTNKDQHAVPPPSSSSDEPPVRPILRRPRVEVNCAWVDWRRPTWRTPDKIGRRPEVQVVEDGALSCLPALLPVSSLVLDYTEAFIDSASPSSPLNDTVTSFMNGRRRIIRPAVSRVREEENV